MGLQKVRHDWATEDTHTHTHTHTHTNLHDLTDSCHLIPFSSLLNMYSRHTDFLSLFLWNKENFVLLQCLCPCYVFFLGYCCTFHSSQNSGYNTLKIIVQSPTILLSRPHLNTSFFFFSFTVCVRIVIKMYFRDYKLQCHRSQSSKINGLNSSAYKALWSLATILANWIWHSGSKFGKKYLVSGHL